MLPKEATGPSVSQQGDPVRPTAGLGPQGREARGTGPRGRGGGAGGGDGEVEGLQQAGPQVPLLKVDAQPRPQLPDSNNLWGSH